MHVLEKMDCNFTKINKSVISDKSDSIIKKYSGYYEEHGCVWGWVQSVAVCLLSVRPMLTMAALAVPAGGLLVAEVLGAADPATATTADAAAAEEDADEEGGGACCRRRALWPSLTIWMMASASASSWRTAAWILLAEPRLVEPGDEWRINLERPVKLSISLNRRKKLNWKLQYEAWKCS